jgi:phosphomannomutase
MTTLREKLDHTPRMLGFGTSGRRGEVVHLTQLEIYLNALGELEYLQTLPLAEGGITKGDTFYFAHDLRPSSTRYLDTTPPRGEIAQAIVAAIEAAGMKPVNLGDIPTPALTYYALRQGKGSIMVTGSHIPFDRNGYKLNTSIGELLKEHEAPVNQSVSKVRERLYAQAFEQSPFNECGLFKSGHRDLPAAIPDARRAYIDRYLRFFEGRSLTGMRLLVYQHSAVGRDLLVDLLRELQADVIPAGRREDFVAIDTENIQAPQIAAIQALVDQHGPVDAVISADGDSDRPLLLLVTGGKAKFYPGDLLGMVTAEYLQADAVVVPVSCNDAIDRGPLAAVLEPKTRIGSPYVIAGIAAAAAKGRKRVCGWEPNGGFLLGSDLPDLARLATRDAVLPMLCSLFARERFAQLPKRYCRAALLPHFPQTVGRAMVRHFSEPGAAAELERLVGLGRIERLDHTDGVRMVFASGEVIHFRPSGNADELRVYAVADTESRAEELAARGVAEPDGILRTLAAAVAQAPEPAR